MLGSDAAAAAGVDNCGFAVVVGVLDEAAVVGIDDNDCNRSDCVAIAEMVPEHIDLAAGDDSVVELVEFVGRIVEDNFDLDLNP